MTLKVFGLCLYHTPRKSVVYEQSGITTNVQVVVMHRSCPKTCQLCEDERDGATAVAAAHPAKSIAKSHSPPSVLFPLKPLPRESEWLFTLSHFVFKLHYIHRRVTPTHGWATINLYSLVASHIYREIAREIAYFFKSVFLNRLSISWNGKVISLILQKCFSSRNLVCHQIPQTLKEVSRYCRRLRGNVGFVRRSQLQEDDEETVSDLNDCYSSRFAKLPIHRKPYFCNQLKISEYCKKLVFSMMFAILWT